MRECWTTLRCLHWLPQLLTTLLFNNTTNTKESIMRPRGGGGGKSPLGQYITPFLDVALYYN